MIYGSFLKNIHSDYQTIFDALAGGSMILIEPNGSGYLPALCERPELQGEVPAHEDYWSRSLIAKLQRSQLKTLFLVWRATHPLFTWALESECPTTAQLVRLYKLKWGALMSLPPVQKAPDWPIQGPVKRVAQ